MGEKAHERHCRKALLRGHCLLYDRAVTVAVATCNDFPLLPDGERDILGALRDLGIGAEPAVWDDAAVNWKDFSGVVIRSTWDYHRKSGAFREWVSRLESSGVPLWNPAPIVRANMAKSYLRGLESAGIPVVATSWIARGDGRSLDSILAERGWTRAVVKPVVSASAFRTRRVARGDAGAQAALDEVLAHSDAMIQPYLEEIEAEGEWSFIFLDGAFSHAALKTPASGDFRVQAEHGGSARKQTPPPELLAQAEAVARLGAKDALYARIDGVRRGGEFLLIELELIEPYLYLDLEPQAAMRLARAIASRLRLKIDTPPPKK
jgi:glutathione synthase/RimK-type ligase-like ATP-grasp enzyme